MPRLYSAMTEIAKCFDVLSKSVDSPHMKKGVDGCFKQIQTLLPKSPVFIFNVRPKDNVGFFYFYLCDVHNISCNLNPNPPEP